MSQQMWHDATTHIVMGRSTDRRFHIVLDKGEDKKYSLCRLVIDAPLLEVHDTPGGRDAVCRSCREAAASVLGWIF